MSERWQEKYSELLASYQKESQQHNDRLTRLQTSFACMALLVDGFDIALDKELSVLIQCLQRDRSDYFDFTALNKVIRGAIDSRKKMLSSVQTELQGIVRHVKQTALLHTDSSEASAQNLHNDFCELESRVLSEVHFHAALPSFLEELHTLQRRGAASSVLKQLPSHFGDDEQAVWKNISFHLGKMVEALCKVTASTDTPNSLLRQKAGDWSVTSMPDFLSSVRRLLHSFRPPSDLEHSDVLSHIEGSLRHLIQITENTLNLILSDSDDSSEIHQLTEVDVLNLRQWVSDSGLDESVSASLIAHVEKLEQRVAQLASLTERQRERDKELKFLQSQLEQLDLDYRELKTTLEQAEAASTQDSLTKLPNRDAYISRARKEMDLFMRNQRPFVLALCDVDHFKRFNDNFGHQVGDQVLFQVAQLLRNNIRDKDFVARYGGEEFVLLLPNSTAKGAEILLNRLREKFSTIAHESDKGRVPITASFGIAEVTFDDSIDSLFYKADMALYRAKSRGRNMCVVEEVRLEEA